jgi:AcrR family transcriptional regulator
MGRPREHDAQTAAALLDAAERIVLVSGLEALSVRRLAHDVGTTTRAVYSLFGSKDGLVVALGTRAFELLGAAINELAATDDPAADLVEAGVAVFRRFAIEHPTLFRIGVQRTLISPDLAGQFRAAAAEAFTGLEARMRRLEDSGSLGPRTVHDAACEFHALCEGLAAVELRGLIPQRDEVRIWRDALTALVAGFAASASQSRRTPRAESVTGVPR